MRAHSTYQTKPTKKPKNTHSSTRASGNQTKQTNRSKAYQKARQTIGQAIQRSITVKKDQTVKLALDSKKIKNFKHNN